MSAQSYRPIYSEASLRAKQIDEETRYWARRSLEHREHFTSQRCGRFEFLSRPHAVRESSGGHGSPGSQPKPSIVPETLLRQIAESEAVDKEPRDQAKRDLEYAKRGEGPAADPVFNEVYINVGLVLKFYQDQFGRDSIDNRNMRVISSVHFGVQYQNAYWDPVRQQIVFGDSSKFLYYFTHSLDIIGHELTYAVTEYTSPLVYQGQSRALNKHISDVFGIMFKQNVENETVASADWLIGEGCLLPGVVGIALYSIKAPGTAYNDARFGRDPQPASIAEYNPTTKDYGGVHIYSGIPNRAFYLASIGLAAAGFSDYSWKHMGQIWWKTMRSGRVPPKCTFVQFADIYRGG
ncbi:hypothetical protein C8A01DRAFT_51520 [Parachaetomium inaequale]|uniref:Uncharacterized protein n=1 Tax=Parachaetomium inaequale TaxID=2588326 RepID=A0AAN6SLE2_9PEZI|nr:hypothetical protein C8A01DRAFT_51520 [Parachaetomium inaequale]